MALTEAGQKLRESGNLNAALKGLYNAQTASDQSFKIALGQELVFAWKDHPEARPALERVMNNVGISQEPVIPPVELPAELCYRGEWVLTLSSGEHKFHLGWIE